MAALGAASAWALLAAPASVTSSMAQPQSRTAADSPTRMRVCSGEAGRCRAADGSSSGTTWMRGDHHRGQQHRGDDGGIDRDAARVAGEFFFLRERGADVADRLAGGPACRLRAAGSTATAEKASIGERRRPTAAGRARRPRSVRRSPAAAAARRQRRAARPGSKGGYAGGEELPEVVAEESARGAMRRRGSRPRTPRGWASISNRARFEQALEFAEVGRIELRCARGGHRQRARGSARCSWAFSRRCATSSAADERVAFGRPQGTLMLFTSVRGLRRRNASAERSTTRASSGEAGAAVEYPAQSVLGQTGDGRAVCGCTQLARAGKWRDSSSSASKGQDPMTPTAAIAAVGLGSCWAPAWRWRASAREAGQVTLGASSGTGSRQGAQPAHQALGEMPQVAGEQFGADADLVQARQRAEDRVGVQGGEHLMAGERGAQAHGGGIGVADLADQDHVGSGAAAHARRRRSRAARRRRPGSGGSASGY